MPLQSSVAESQGFEPWEDLTPRSISSAVPSTTRTTLHDGSLRHRPPISCWKQERKTGEKTLESDIWTISDVQQFQGIRVFLLPKCNGVFECCTFDHSDNSPTWDFRTEVPYIIRQFTPLCQGENARSACRNCRTTIHLGHEKNK